MYRRIEGYDFARAIAIVLMVLVNFQYYLMVRPSGDASEVLPRWIFDLPSGRSSSLFVTLAGCGVSLMSRGNASGARKTLLLRALFLLVAGNLLILVWDIDILHFYAFYLALALLFVRVPSRWLLAIAVLLIATAGIGAQLVGDPLEDLEYYTPGGMAADVFLNGVHPVLPWLSFVLVGMCIGRLDLAQPAVRQRLLMYGASATVIAELVSWGGARLALFEVIPLWSARMFGTGWTPAPLFVVSAAGTAACAIALSHAIVDRWGQRGWARVLIATGQLAFTIYIAHALVGVVVWTRFFGARDSVSMPMVIAWWVLFVQGAMICAYLWRRRFARGPLETLMRWIAGAPKTESNATPPEEVSRPPRAPWVLIAAAAVPCVLAPIFGSIVPIGCPRGRLAIGERAVSELTLVCPHRDYELVVTERTPIELSTTSSIDPYVVLLRNGRTIDEDDDSGPSTDARVRQKLEPGRYIVRVRPFSSGVGPFAITAARRRSAPPPESDPP